MAIKKIVEVEVKSDQAVAGLGKIEDALERVDKAAEQASDETKSLGEEVGESGAAISLLDAATGGLASRVRDVAEVYKTFRGRLLAVTAAQIKANLAAAANPYVIVGTAVAALTVGLAKYASKVSDNVIPFTTSLKNIFLSLGNSITFARLQAEAYTEGMTDVRIKEMERAIEVQKAFGTETIEQEIELQRLRLERVEKDTEEYYTLQTQLSVMLAQRSVAETEKAKQAKLAELQLIEQEEREARESEKLLQEFDKGADEGVAYAEGRIFGQEQVVKAQEDFAFIDLRKEELEEEILLEHEAAKEKIQIEEDLKKQKLAIASETLGAIAGILGQNSKAGKAAGIAQAIINTYQGVTEVLKNPTVIPEPFGTIQKIASVGTVLASGMQAVRAMQQTPIPVIGVGGGSVGGGFSMPASAPPQVSTVGTSGVNQLAQTISQKSSQPVKAYVVAGEVSSAQSLERNAVKEASI